MIVKIGSPIYDRPEPAFVTCLIDTLDLLRERGHQVDWRYAQAIIHQARNYLMKDMMGYEPDVLVQIDSDQQWDPTDVVAAVETVSAREADIIGFAYLDRKPANAREVRWVSPTLHGPARSGFEREGRRYIEVDGLGGGILVTSYECVARLSKDAPRQYLGDAPLVFDFSNDCGEDEYFCRRWKAMGGKVHCDMTSLVGHVGTRVYAMDPSHLLATLKFEEECDEGREETDDEERTETP